MDEAGRGPLAGPVVAAAVMLDTSKEPPFPFKDSKTITREKREKLCRWLKDGGGEIGLGIVEHDEIEKINIHNASLLAMKKAVASLKTEPEMLLIDGKFTLDMPIRQKAIIKGDSKVPAISAASIVAKVTRDEIMQRYHAQFPQYGFDRHKGYPTAAHKGAILKHGPCAIHRKTFRGVKEVC